MRARSSAWWSARLITGPSIEQASNLLDAPSNKRLTSSTLELDSIRENRLTSNPIVSYPEILYKVIDDQGFREYLRHRYHRNYASWIYTSAKFLAKVVNDPYLLKRLSYRRARGVFEAVPAVKEYAKLVYGVDLDIDTKYLRKFMPAKEISEVTESIIEFEIKETDAAKTIIDKALEYIDRIMKSNSKYRIPVITEFFTGLRPSEVVYMLHNWDKLRKIKLDGVYLIVLNYDRKTKKAYFTLIPEQLYQIIDSNKPYIFSSYFKDHVRQKYEIRLYTFRKAWIAITSRYLDDAERDLLQGRLRSIQIKHYIKHIKSIAKRYLEAFKPYLYILDVFSQDTGKDTVHQE